MKAVVNLYQDFEGKTLAKGYGTTIVRLNHNFSGNDGDAKTALGIIPYISFYRLIRVARKLAAPLWATWIYTELAVYFLQDVEFYFADGGLICNIGDNIKIDVATNLGLTETAPTRVYPGRSFRI